MARTLKEGQPVRGEEVVAVRPDGASVPLLPHPTPIFDDTGALTGAVNVLMDLSGAKDMERSSRYLAAIVESSDDAIVAKNLDGIITSWNRGAQRLFGYAAEEVIGESITILIPPERLSEEPGILERIRRGELVDHFETKRRRKDGTLVDISLTVSPSGMPPAASSALPRSPATSPRRKAQQRHWLPAFVSRPRCIV